MCFQFVMNSEDFCHNSIFIIVNNMPLGIPKFAVIYLILLPCLILLMASNFSFLARVLYALQSAISTAVHRPRWTLRQWTHELNWLNWIELMAMLGVPHTVRSHARLNSGLDWWTLIWYRQPHGLYLSKENKIIFAIHIMVEITTFSSV